MQPDKIKGVGFIGAVLIAHVAPLVIAIPWRCADNSNGRERDVIVLGFRNGERKRHD